MPIDREKFPPLYQTVAANDAGLAGQPTSPMAASMF